MIFQILHNPWRKLCWLGIGWNTEDTTLALSPQNTKSLQKHLRGVYFSKRYLNRKQEALLGVLNFVTLVLPLGRPKSRCLTWEVNAAILQHPRDQGRQIQSVCKFVHSIPISSINGFYSSHYCSFLTLLCQLFVNIKYCTVISFSEYCMRGNTPLRNDEILTLGYFILHTIKLSYGIA